MGLGEAGTVRDECEQRWLSRLAVCPSYSRLCGVKENFLSCHCRQVMEGFDAFPEEAVCRRGGEAESATHARLP